MNAFLIVLTFAVIWWIIFYMVLPFGIEKPKNIIQGNDTGAPEKSDLLYKVIVTTILAFLFTFIVCYLLVKINFYSLFK